MSRLTQGRTVAFVSTYPPVQCGIATFTRDLANAVELHGWTPLVVAVDKGEVDYADQRVIWRIHKHRAKDYEQAAQFLNTLQPTAVSLQHEYGLFGGEMGEEVLRFVRALQVPLFVTLHTVEPQPSDIMRRILHELVTHAQGVMVMSHAATRLLKQVYRLPAHHVRMIPHGAPEVPFTSTDIAKNKLGLQGRKVISTFGLISRGKGIEDVIAAMQGVVQEYPDALYLVLGQTHPNVRVYEGESYRESLEALVEQLGLQNNVRFVNSYLTQETLLRYLAATDIYITPYPHPGQISSGTLTYALACGCAVVSTPYLYAQELLADGRGELVPFRNPQAIAQTLKKLLGDDSYRERLRYRAYYYSRHMTWSSVGAQFSQWLARAAPVYHATDAYYTGRYLSPAFAPGIDANRSTIAPEQPLPDAV
ncbi:MAG: glycosyltransferase family 4 protein [Armatimonadota bacterium]|nr:glycosyltransferase family 4 protein [bacterium]MDW8321011.1 glycosyltransferase family 4 protein [Armatimonadota bacterium]